MEQSKLDKFFTCEAPKRQKVQESDTRQICSEVLSNSEGSQGGRGHFTYLLEGQIHFALKLSVTCLI